MTNRVKKRKSRRSSQSTQKWGDQIRQWREAKGWSRAELIARYQKKLEGLNPDYQFSEIPSETWLARVERDESVEVSRLSIHVLCDALECTPNQLMTIMICADRNILADPNGEMTAEGELLAHTVTSLQQSDATRKVIQECLRGRQITDLHEDDFLDTLLEVIHAVKLERARLPMLCGGTTRALGGAD